MNTWTKLALTMVGAAALLAAAVAALALPADILVDAGSGEPTEVSLDQLERRSYVYGSEGEVLAGLHGEINREPVTLDDVPEHLVQAILAVEDSGFWVHDGVDARGILRAFSVNVDEGEVAQGGSTLTQQVVKLALLGNEQSLERKVQEVILARRLEREMTKEEILTRYVNLAYFGHSAYGVQAAAETYFGVPASELDAGQSALLAGMIRNPRVNDPVRNPGNAEARRATALERMESEGFITAEERVWFDAAPLPTEVQQVVPRPDDYFVDEVQQQLLHDDEFAMLGETYEEREQAVFTGGLRVHTTFSPQAQQHALAARDEHLPGENGVFDVGPHPETGEMRRGSGAVVSVEPSTGAVRTMVAGPGFQRGVDEAVGQQFNLVTDNERQPGSTQKTFILTEMMEQGHSPLDRVDGTGTCRFANPGGTPDPAEINNYGDSTGGVDTILGQTARSSNCAYVRLSLIAGREDVSDTARRMGVTNGLNASDISMALGTREATPLQMASAYATLANDGVYNEPYYIERIEGPDGRVIYEHEQDPQRAVSAESARLVTHVLEHNVAAGTGTRAALPGQQTAGKTGTTDENSDVWFVGYTPHLATAVWVGGLEGRFPLRIEGVTPSSSRQPAQIFGSFMAAYHADREPLPFASPPDRHPADELLAPDPEVDLSGRRTLPGERSEGDDEDESGDGEDGSDDSNGDGGGAGDDGGNGQGRGGGRRSPGSGGGGTSSTTSTSEATTTTTTTTTTEPPDPEPTLPGPDPPDDD